MALFHASRPNLFYGGYRDHLMETLYYSRMSSPAGPLLIGVSDSALVALEFDRGLPQTIFGQPVAWEESAKRARPVRQQLEEYFAGKRRTFELELDLRGTEFRKRCWNELLQIPYGETRSYADIARAVGNPNGLSRRRAGESLQSHRHHRSLSSRARFGMLSGRLWRRAAGEGAASEAGGLAVSRGAWRA